MIAKNDDIIREILNNLDYEITENGQLFYKKKPVHIRDKHGYKCYRYRRNKYKEYWVFIHRMVYQKFKGELDSNLTINHIDGNPGNNYKDNLELVTQGKNNEHQYKLGRKPEKGNAKITFEIAEQIRADYRLGLSIKELTIKWEPICGLRAKSNYSYIVRNMIWNTP